MKCLVIGGSGFVGSRLIPELEPTWNVVNLDKADSREFGSITHRIDVREPDSFMHHMQGCDTVVLLAAEHRDDVTPASLYFDVNVQGMRNILASMDQYGVRRIVFISTVAIYGLDISTPLCETDRIDPFNDYGRSKWEAEKILQEWIDKDKRRSALVLRPTVIFGEGNRGNVYNLINQIYSGNFLMIGDGCNKKSMSYVGNIVSFIAYMLNSHWHGTQVFNYVDTPDFDMNTLVAEVYRFKGKPVPQLRIPYRLGIFVGTIFDIVAKITRHKFPISSIRVKKFCANTLVDGSKLNATQYIRPFTLMDGLQKMLTAEFSSDDYKFGTDDSQ
jgi:nucleoside-diphosphate-sugar epimerase